ncbi:hypothetical protein KUM39_15775 [Streptomyces sp. J2-1]|uniref:hypothetical protein n=1 Tax=Streptomyces corallincola TaxID=2851888 RepID=UPI001C38DBDF|nr:hypothetical protein [Streptomyces corallincola]MBV2355816.1 hypothetical protein [Streptomyces corallincola]
MQHPAVPELAHTHTRPIHWVATATAVAGVIALSSLVHPGPAAAEPAPDAKAPTAPAHRPAPGTDGVHFPLPCGPVKAVVVSTASGDLDGDGNPETVAVVHCDAPMGTPPDALYVLTRGTRATTPRVVATLVDPEDRITVTRLTVHDRAVGATLLGYSSTDVPRCCPDTKTPTTWRWNGTAFRRTTGAGVHTV